MASSDWTKRYHQLVMNMNAFRPMDEEERRRDWRYALVIVTFLVIIPMLAFIPYMVTGSLLVGLSIVVASMGVALAIGMHTRHRIFSDFFCVDDARPYVELHELSDRTLFERLCDERALAFRCSFEVESLTLIYDWLVAREALDKGEKIQAYRLDRQDFMRVLGGSVEPSFGLLVIPYGALHLPKKQELRFASELPVMGGAWLGNAEDVGEA